MIKKILYKLIFFTIISNLFIYNSFADGTCESGCSIKNGTPEVILDYISNNRKIIKNISKNLGESFNEYDIPTSASTDGKNVNINNTVSTGIGLRIYNSLFNWNEVRSGFKYFLSNIDGDVPAPISRDLRLIDNQNRSLNYFLSKIIKNGQSFGKIDVKKVCEGIDDNGKCELFLGNNVESAITNLINNNNIINLIIRKELGFMGFKSIVGSSSYNELFLVSQNFKQEIKSNYNKQTYKSCAECKGGSLNKIKESLNRVVLNDKRGKDGINEWKNAWNLLLGINDDDNKKNDKAERKLLNEELAKQGISSNNGDIVLKNLKESQGNDFGMSVGNNPITNSFEHFVEQISKPFKSKQVTVLTETVGSIASEAKNIKILNFDEIIYSKQNLSDDEEIFQNIKEVISQNQAIISRQNKNTDKLQGRIIQLHINLIQAINTLDKITPKTEKICNDQDSGNGKCIYRK